MLIQTKAISYTAVTPPPFFPNIPPVDLTADTMQLRKEKILEGMASKNLDALLIYADREHGGNFGYLTGFEPRFEEAVLILWRDGKSYLLLGNESLRMGQYSMLPSECIHVPHFSLPNQPMEVKKSISGLLADAGIHMGISLGCVGWKLFTSREAEENNLFDIPHFIITAAQSLIGTTGRMVNACSLFIDPQKGARITVNANEAAHFAFGAAHASDCIHTLLDEIELGKTELDLGTLLSYGGQPLSVQSICATGERFTNAVVAPRQKALSLGDKFSATMGLRGGLTCRTGYLVSQQKELPPSVSDYLDAVAIPYFAALATWYSSVSIGLKGEELYHTIDEAAPKKLYGWTLNPGHLTSSEEWLSSPIYPGSQICLQSGMMLQADIILSVPGYGGCNGEDGILIADPALRSQIQTEYPILWDIIQQRRSYMINKLGIPLHEEVLPLSNLCGYLRPYMLCKDKAFCITNGL